MTELDEKASIAACDAFEKEGHGFTGLREGIKAYLSHSPVPAVPDDVREAVETVLRLDGEATKEPWLYRPGAFDDWGWVRAAPTDDAPIGYTVAQAKAGRSVSEGQFTDHRNAKTDPYGHNGRLIAAYRSLAPLLARHIKTSGEPR